MANAAEQWRDLPEWDGLVVDLRDLPAETVLSRLERFASPGAPVPR